MNDPIFITGAPRSGTSLVAGILDVCGAWGGDTVPANDLNPKGYFENRFLRNMVVKNYLKLIKVCQYGQLSVPPRDLPPLNKEEALAWRNMIKKQVKAQGYKKGKWYFKDPKLCLIWRVFNSSFPSSKWVIVRRREEDIVRSIMKTDFMIAYDTEEQWHALVKEYVDRLEDMKNAPELNCFEIWPDEIVKGSHEQFKPLIEWAGLPWREKQVKEFILPEAWHA